MIFKSNGAQGTTFYFVFVESRLNAPLIQYSHLCNRDVGTVYCFVNQTVRLDSDYLKMFGDFKVHGIIRKLVLATQDLDLTPEEQALTVAVSIMATRKIEIRRTTYIYLNSL